MTIPTPPRTIIALGRAYIRLIEAAQVIGAAAESDAEETLMAELVTDYQAGLRQLLASVPSHVAAEILVASERLLGPVQEQRLN